MPLQDMSHTSCMSCDPICAQDGAGDADKDFMPLQDIIRYSSRCFALLLSRLPMSALSFSWRSHLCAGWRRRCRQGFDAASGHQSLFISLLCAAFVTSAYVCLVLRLEDAPPIPSEHSAPSDALTTEESLVAAERHDLRVLRLEDTSGKISSRPSSAPQIQKPVHAHEIPAVGASSL